MSEGTDDDINARDAYGNTLLHHAALSGAVERVQELLDKGADVHAVNDDGSSVVRAGAVGGSASVVALLLKSGGDADAGTESGSTPLHVAVDRGHAAVVAELVAGGADPHPSDSRGSTPLSIALAKWQEADLDAAEQAIELLIAAGPVDWGAGCAQAGGAPLIHFAAAKGKLHLALDHVQTLRSAVWDGLLHAVVSHPGNTPSIAKLAAVLPELDPEAHDESGNTVLHALFVKPTPDQRTAGLAAAVFEVYGDAMRAIVNDYNDAGLTPLLMALNQDAAPDAIQVLVDAGADVAAAPSRSASKAMGNRTKLPALLYAVATKHEAAVEVLLTAPGLDVNAVRAARTKRTALHLAAKSGSLLKVSTLLDAGADPTVRDSAGKTPLDLARKAPVIALLEPLTHVDAAPETAAVPAPSPGSKRPRPSAMVPPWKRAKYRA